MDQPVQTTTPSSVQPPRSSTNSVIALILGILSLACCGSMAGIPAIILGRSELKAIQEGRVDVSNHTVAKIGLILGIVGTILSALGTLIYVAMIALGISAGMLESMNQ